MWERERERGSSLLSRNSKMASSTATLSTLCASFGTHCSISLTSKTQFSVSQPFSSSFPFPSHKSSYNLSFQSTFSPRLRLLPKSTDSTVAAPESESELSSLQTDSQPTQIVQSPTWEKGLFAVVMVSFL